jgi:hypothetical protein
MYRNTRLSFGHKNVPGIFQKTLQGVLGDSLNSCVILYIDDMVIYGKTHAGLLGNLIEFMSRLKEHNFKVLLSKIWLLKKEIE